MKRLLLAAIALFGLFGLTDAHAQNAFVSPGGSIANGTVQMCINAAGQAIPVGQGCANGYSYAHIAAGAAATHVIKASAGVLHTICFNGPATATNTTTVYDNATGSGTVIAVPLATAVVMPVCEILDVAFVNGLTIITATANGGDMTISYQ